MASKKTQSVKKVATKAKAAAKKAAPKAKAKPKTKAVPVKAGPRHPMARVAEAHGSKAALATAIAKAIARADQDTGALESQLKKASNAQLLRLERATQTLKDKFGDRNKLIAAIGAATNKSKDKDYLARLDSYSLPQLLDLAAASQRAART
jgi:histone H1/5